MSNLKKDIRDILGCTCAFNEQYDSKSYNLKTEEYEDCECVRKIPQILNLIESVLPKEDEHTWRAYGQLDGTVVCSHCNVAEDVNNLLLSQVADIKSKLIDGSK